MHKIRKIWFMWALLPSLNAWAAPLQTTYHIKVDQFGYFTNATKYAVIADPQVALLFLIPLPTLIALPYLRRYIPAEEAKGGVPRYSIQVTLRKGWRQSVMVGDAAKAGKMAEFLLTKGIYAIGFSYPVVPMGKARIRTQVSAAHTEDELKYAAAMFAEASSAVA